MIERRCAALAAFLLLFAAIPAAQAARAVAEVEAVQMPAWLVRDSRRTALPFTRWGTSRRTCCSAEVPPTFDRSGGVAGMWRPAYCDARPPRRF